MELEGTLILERPASRRWLSVVGIVVPIVILTGGAAWFIRAYVAPPMATIPAPIAVAAAPPPAPAHGKTRPPAAPEPSPAAVAKAAQPEPPPETASPPPQPAGSLPMFASLVAAPPALNATAPPVAYAEPTPEMPAPSAEQAPMAGPVPLPRQRPRDIVALVTGMVPLPRARPAAPSAAPPPTETVPAQPQPSSPAFDRHTVE